MKVFISGATGFIGGRLAIKLAETGHTVHALYRNEKKTERLRHKNIILFKGDILDKKSLDAAIIGCQQVYHTAAYASVWTKDTSLIYKLNVEGSLNIIEVSQKQKVEKIVITSTAGVLGASKSGSLNENSYPENHFTDYEKSKARLEEIIREHDHQKIAIVLVNPSRVYGPGLLSESNSVSIMIDKYIQGKWHLIPGNGESIGNYVFIEDVVKGHILAMEKGIPGERYILGGDNCSFKDFFRKLSQLSGKQSWMINIPFPVMLVISRLMISLANMFGIPPRISPSHVNKFRQNFNLDISKAKKDLNYQPLSLEEGIKKTIFWLNEKPSQY